jgi:hypothetical protein
MQIQKLTLDDDDMIQAVQMFLATKGFNAPVAHVSREYNWQPFEITFEFEIPVPESEKKMAQVSEAAIDTTPSSTLGSEQA